MIVYDKEQKQIVIPNGIGNIDIYNNGVEAGYNEGYDQGQADMVEKARVLEVTENGVYGSKYSDPMLPNTVTGVYADGTKFYSYAELNGKVFNTKIAATKDSRLEFWYKDSNKINADGRGIIIGAGDIINMNCFKVRYNTTDRRTLFISLGSDEKSVKRWNGTVWHHLIISKAEGIWIDGEKKGDFMQPYRHINGEFYINGIGYDAISANGYFGMIKIDDTVIIPTADGFLNTNTGELLEVVKDGDYTFTENTIIYGEGGLYKTINVNVPDLNGSYDQGQADMAAEARVLEVTKNGVYRSKYSDPIVPDIVTGVYDDGTDFYSYAVLGGDIFNTKIAATVDSRLEFWYKGDNTSVGFGDNVIIGAGNNDDNNYFQVRYYEGFNGWVKISIGNSTIDINNWDDKVWHHLIISKAEGLWVDGEKKGDFSPSNTINGEFFINGIGYDTARNANGSFGMIKIDDTIIIPAVNGFLNTNTGEMLEKVKKGSYVFWGEEPSYPKGALYKTINVNIDVDSYYNNGYNQGKTDGANEQKTKLESISITENGTYDREDGYNHIEVNVPDLNGSYDEGYAEGERVGYNQGKTDGINEQKGKLSQITISENGTYAKEDGYSEVVVNVPDLNGSYNEGYAQGKTDGVNEQKGKLESISITENGVYSKEDGYNHIEVNVPDLNGSYDEGYKQGQADVEANARVLNVTENGVYKSKYSDPIFPDTYTVTGEYADGTKFYNYAELNGKVFNTKIAGSVDSRLEFWYKGDRTVSGGGWNAIIGAGNNDNRDCFQVRYWDNDNSRLLIEIGNSGMNYYDWDDTVWHHLILSKAEGLWIDGEKKGDFSPSNTINGEFLINGTGYNVNSNANGCFGMIKIDDVVFIPTADGFQNVNTGELLEVVKDGAYTFTENLPIYGEGELYKTINVNIDVDSYYNNGYSQGKTDGVNEQKGKLESINITANGRYTKEDGYNEIVVEVPGSSGIPKVNVKETGLKLGYSTFTEVPEWVDFEGITDMSNMFMGCGYLTTIPQIDTSNVTDMREMLNGCGSLKTIPMLDTSKVTTMQSMFKGCSNLETIPLLDTSKVTNMNQMFSTCSNLKTIPQIDTSNVTDMSQMFYYYTTRALVSLPKFECGKLTSLTLYFNSNINSLTDVGGWNNLKIDWKDNNGLAKCPNLTYQSCINVLNGLYDFVGNGLSTRRTLKVHKNFLTTVGDEISIGTLKGWSIIA